MNWNILAFATRYALGRRTYAPIEVCREISAQVHVMPQEECVRLLNIIVSHAEKGSLGPDDCYMAWLMACETLSNRIGEPVPHLPHRR